MRIAICIKQVPDLEALEFDPVTKTVKREGVMNLVNTYEKHALSAAKQLVEQAGEGEIAVITMGPPQAKDALRELLAAGADRALHLNDRAFAGSDTLATSRALSAAIRQGGYDLVFCGKYSLDAETGQVGPELAEMVDLPQVTNARRVELAGEGLLAVTRMTDDGTEELRVPLPALITVPEDVAPMARPNRQGRETVDSKPYETVTAADLGLDPETLGLKGSPTWVQEITTVQVERQVRMIAADDLGAAARDLARLLVEEEGLFAGWKGGVEAPAPAPTQRAKTSDRAVWVTAELYGGQLRPVTLELLGEAVNLATRLGSEVGVLLLGHWPAAESAYSERTAPANGRIASAPGTPAPATQAPFSVMAGEGATVEPASSATRGPSSVDAGEGAPVGPAAPATRGPSSAAAGEGALQAWPESVGLDALIERLGAHGADVVYVADDPRLAHYDTELYSGILADAIERLRPYAVLLPSTANGRDWAPRVAARLELGLTGDCIGFELNDDDLLVQLKPAFGGNIVAPILSKTLPQMATVRPGVLRALQPNPARTARVERLTIEHLPPSRVEWLSAEPSVGAAGIELETADTVVGVGFGLGGPDNLPVVNELAGVLGASVAATRKIVDLGWLPRQQQVGLTGKVISPRLYFAVGIRGFFNHTIGIQKAHTVVAINRDPEAAIFQVANYGVAADALEFLPLLTRELREARAKAKKS